MGVRVAGAQASPGIVDPAGSADRHKRKAAAVLYAKRPLMHAVMRQLSACEGIRGLQLEAGLFGAGCLQVAAKAL